MQFLNGSGTIWTKLVNELILNVENKVVIFFTFYWHDILKYTASHYLHLFNECTWVQTLLWSSGGVFTLPDLEYYHILLSVLSLSKYISVCMYTLCLVFNVLCKCIYAFSVLINSIKAEVVEVPKILNRLCSEFVRLRNLSKNPAGRQLSYCSGRIRNFYLT